MGALIYVGLCALLGLVPANIAKSKGRDFNVWWLYGSALFPVAFIHSLLMSPTTDSDEGRKQIALARASGHALVSEEFVADGVIGRVPYRNEMDGSVTAIVDGRKIKFRRFVDLEAMVKSLG